jgi:hypothetical protein
MVDQGRPLSYLAYQFIYHTMELSLFLQSYLSVVVYPWT